jgi:hypothetical protein
VPTRARITPGDGSEHHGTVNGYRNYRCRCEPCRQAWAGYFRWRRGGSRRKPRYPPP